MSRPTRSRALPLTGAALATAALVFAAAAPASAHTDDLFTFVQLDGNSGFGSVSKTDAAMAFLGAATDLFITGAEIVGEQGYGVAVADEVGPVVFRWNHDTGAISTPVPLVIDSSLFLYGDEEFDFAADHVVIGLDSLTDGTLLTIIAVDSEEGGEYYQGIVAVDPATGEVEPLVKLPLIVGATYSSIATDPTTGTTYVFYFYPSGISTAIVVDLELGLAPLDPLPLTGVSELFDDSGGFPLGADFDAAGVLWHVVGVDELEEYHLLRFPAPFATTATPVDLGELPWIVTPGQVRFESTSALALDPAAAPAGLPDTGHDLGGVLLAAGALGLLGLAGVSLSIRRRTA